MDLTPSIENFQSTWSKDRLTAISLVIVWLYVGVTVIWHVLKHAILSMFTIMNPVIRKLSVVLKDASEMIKGWSYGPIISFKKT